MERRRYLAVSSLTLIGLAGCSSSNDSEENSSDSQQPEDRPEDRNSTETNQSNPESTDSEQEDTEDQLTPPEVGSISLEPAQRGPDGKVPRGTDIVATITGRAALNGGGNELIAELRVRGQDQSEEQTKEIVVSGEGESTDFEAEITFSTERLLPGVHTVSVRLTDEDINANTVGGDVEFDLAEYYLSTIEILEELNNYQQQAVNAYTSYGSVSTIDQVPVVLDGFEVSDVRDPVRDARQKWSEFDVEAPDSLDDISTYEEAENAVLWEITYTHEEFVGFTTTVIDDLEVLREIEFESYSEIPDEYVEALNQYIEIIESYSDSLDSLEVQHSTLEQAVEEIGSQDEPFNYSERVETFEADITSMREVIPALERIQSAAEIILVGGTLEEGDDRSRREARLDAVDRIQGARDILNGLEAPTSSGVVEEVIDLSNDLENAAEEL